ncbi:MAG TPA: DedA family protein [Burkholderiaceae bacterium]|nr:DedA family protein [Burkholderiaceae bacterium]
MDFSQLIDIFLHLDKHLAAVVDTYGPLVYGLLFLIVFVETGVVVMPFLPGDSLLFVAGTLAGIGALDLPLLLILLFAAAVIGDNTNYWIGRKLGPKVFQWENSKFFNRAAFDRTHAFYEKYGPLTIIIARFMPFVRTFSPFVAGVGAMTYSRFLAWDIVGGIIWVGGLTTLGYLIGNLPWVKEHFSLVTLAMIVIPGLPAVFEVCRQLLRRARRVRQPQTPNA